MAVPPVSPAKDEPAAASLKAGRKRKRPLPSASGSKPTHQPQPRGADAAPLPAPKRNKSPGIRVVGGRIYDPEHGKTCHQCRQKTMDFAAACNGTRRGKPCPIQFCHKCLLNRYGEKAEEMAAREDWSCPKCRGICNCSFCMKKKGHQPTGILVHAAKKTGYSSVSEMLQFFPTRSEADEVTKDADATSDRPPSSGKLVQRGKKHGKEKSCAPNEVLDLKVQTSKSSKEKIESLNAGVKEKSKMSKLKRENCNVVVCDLTTINTNGKAKFLGKKVLDEGLGRRGKKEDKMGEREEELKDPQQKKKSTFERKTKWGSVNEKAQGFNGSSVHEEKGDLLKNFSVEVQNPTKKQQMDIRKAFSDGAEKEVLVHEGGNGAESEVLPGVCKEKKHALSSTGDSPDSVVEMPQGTRLTTVAGIELQGEEVGPAMQFLEFCSVFQKVLDIRKGEPECVIRELSCGRAVRRGFNSVIVQFYIKLLSRIQKQNGERPPLCAASDGTWLKALKKCITESPYASEELPLNCLNNGVVGYASLDSSKKLRLLNFLCDELLGTEEMRNWIDNENAEFTEKRKEAREKVLAAKEEERHIKKKLKDEVAQAMLELRNGAPLTISEHKDLVSKIKTESEKAHAEVLGSLDLLRKKKQRPDALRTEPIFSEDGQAYWRLKGYNSSRIVLQDIGNRSLIVPQDKWFFYDDEQEKLIEKCIFRSRKRGSYGLEIKNIAKL